MRVTELRSRLKRNSVVFFTFKKLTDHLYRSNLFDYINSKNVKPREVIRKEMALMKNYWKCDPMCYYRYRLFEKELTVDELLDYIPPYYFFNYYIPSVYSEAKIKESENKILMNAYYTSKNISVPVMVAITHKGNIFTKNGEVEDFKGLLKILQASDAESFFMKPATGKGGKGISRIEKSGQEFLINGERFNEKSFMASIKSTDYIIQETVIQRSDLRQINPASVNTLRAITQNINGKGRLCMVYMRVGRNGTFVDNIGAGGISVPIDYKTGVMGRYAYRQGSNSRFETHPDTGFRFEGFEIKEWETIKAGIVDFATKASDFPALGWDIAITDDGIVAIESNTMFGIDFQGLYGGLRRKLDVYPNAVSSEKKLTNLPV